MSYETARQIRQRFGGISDMTLWRWLNDDRLGFPQPLVINRRRYFSVADVEAFQERQAARTASADRA